MMYVDVFFTTVCLFFVFCFVCVYIVSPFLVLLMGSELVSSISMLFWLSHPPVNCCKMRVNLVMGQWPDFTHYYFYITLKDKILEKRGQVLKSKSS